MLFESTWAQFPVPNGDSQLSVTLGPENPNPLLDSSGTRLITDTQVNMKVKYP